MRVEPFGKPDAWKLARPVWGWGRGEIPRPTLRHARGTLEGATRFAEHLKRDYFPGLYYEVSTHGNGIQGFVVVDRSCWKDADYKATIQQVEKWLKRVLRNTTVAEDVQTALAVVRACTLDMNADGSMPVMRVKAIWDAAYRASDTSRAFSFRRFAAIRGMLSHMGLLEWEDETYSFDKACKWRASGELMAMIEKALNADTTTNSSSLSILVCNSVEEARQDRPDQVGLRREGSSRRT